MARFAVKSRKVSIRGQQSGTIDEYYVWDRHLKKTATSQVSVIKQDIERLVSLMNLIGADRMHREGDRDD